jgi:hypothetical protein
MTEGTDKQPKRISNAYAALAPLRPEAAQKRKKALGVGVTP